MIIALQRTHGTDWGFLELMAAFQSSPLGLREMVEPIRPDVLAFMGITEDGEFTKTSIGYVTNLLAAATPLLRPLAISWGTLDRADRVSLTDWVHAKGSSPRTLILQNREDFPAVSGAWLRQVIKKLVRTTGSSRLPDDPARRIWFVLDEFVQLGKMTDLLKVPETHRSKGVILMLTAQSISQIYNTYKQHRADTLLELMTTKIIMRTGQGGDTAKRINSWIGKLRWRDPADSGITETGMKAIAEHENDLLSQSYISTLGKNRNGVDGLVIGIGPDVYRVRWPFVTWPKHRVAIDPADWAKQ